MNLRILKSFYPEKPYKSTYCFNFEMLVQLLGILDLIAAITLLGLQFNLIEFLALPVIAYLLIKGIIFIKDPLSIIEIIIGVYTLFLLIGFKTQLTYLFVLYLLYKAVISFM